MASLHKITHLIEHMGDSIFENEIGMHDPGVIDKSLVPAYSHGNIGPRAGPQ